jgi:hypothetical protein
MSAKLFHTLLNEIVWSYLISRINNLLKTKLNYIHLNPMHELWNLVSKPEDYEFSSARFYELGELEEVNVSHYNDYL